ncbi:MAG: alpha/beta fold hydrolase [Chloroflexota bacterium]
MPTTKVNDINIHYEINGSGKAVVLISGLGYPLWQWHKMVPYLSKHFKVITFDNRGVGETDKPAGNYSAQMLAADTAGLLNSLGVEKAVILGHSMGGYVAQAMALDFPDKVDKLILCSTNFGGPRHIPITMEAWSVLSDTTSDPLTRFKNGLAISTAPGWAESHPEEVQEWVNWRISNPLDLVGYQSQMAIGLGLIAEDAAFENRLPDVKAPTLILFGENDKVVPPANASLLASKIPTASVVILPVAGHFFPIEVPEAASQAVIDFIKQEVPNQN